MSKGITKSYDEEDGENKVKPRFIQYSKIGNSFIAAPETRKTLPVGYYKINSTMEGIFFELQDPTLDSIDILPESKSEEIINEIKQFWGLKDKFKEHGFLHKRGILVFGPQGTGKTTALNLAVKQIVKMGGIAVFSRNPSALISGLNLIREVEPNRPIVVLIEDLDKLIRYDEEEVLSLLDGESQIENVVFVATTNYIEKLPQRIVNRPSRFDAIIEIGLPSEKIRESFLMNKINTTNGPNGEDLIAMTEGLSISHIKELIIGVYCQERPLNEVITKLRTMNSSDVSGNLNEVLSKIKESAVSLKS